MELEEAARRLVEQPARPPAPLAQIERRAAALARQRLRAWLAGAASVLIAVALIGPVVWPRSSRGQVVSSHPPIPVLGPPQPSVDAAALRGGGRLAFVSQGRLYLLDGKSGTVHAVPGPGTASSPKWSPDGKWVAFARDADTAPAPPFARPPSYLWVVGADGADLHQVMVSGSPVSDYAWSPADDDLAVSTFTGSGSQTLFDVPLQGPPRQLASTGYSSLSFAWSPDGKTLAFTSLARSSNGPGPFTGQIETIGADGSSRRVVYASFENAIILGGWWPNGRGLLFWLDTQASSSIAADGLPLESLALDRGAVHQLAHTLVNRNWLAWAPLGNRIAVVTGADRAFWNDSQIAVCDVTTSACQPILPIPNTVAFDPVWTPSLRLEYVRAAAGGGRIPGFGPDALTAWDASRQLFVTNSSDATTSEPVAGTQGAIAPVWAKGSLATLYIQNDVINLIRGNQRPRRVAGPVFGGKPPPGYYGMVPWPDQFAWWQS
jgi:dipeptidyl aminopeptidase/acylaminoacyl peptidase